VTSKRERPSAKQQTEKGDQADQREHNADNPNERRGNRNHGNDPPQDRKDNSKDDEADKQTDDSGHRGTSRDEMHFLPVAA